MSTQNICTRCNTQYIGQTNQQFKFPDVWIVIDLISILTMVKAMLSMSLYISSRILIHLTTYLFQSMSIMGWIVFVSKLTGFINLNWHFVSKRHEFKACYFILLSRLAYNLFVPITTFLICTLGITCINIDPVFCLASLLLCLGMSAPCGCWSVSVPFQFVQ